MTHVGWPTLSISESNSISKVALKRREYNLYAIELVQSIFCDASDALNNLEVGGIWIDDKDEVDCSQCMESHDSRKMFVEQMRNIQDQALELEKQLCQCEEGCTCGTCHCCNSK